MSVLYRQGKLPAHAFSLCLSLNGGLLGLGGFNDSTHKAAIVWTPLLPSAAFYTVRVTRVALSGADLDADLVAAVNRYVVTPARSFIPGNMVSTECPPFLKECSAFDTNYHRPCWGLFVQCFFVHFLWPLVDFKSRCLGMQCRGDGTIVDSGTTFTYLAKPVFRAVVGFISKYCSLSARCIGEQVNVPDESLCWRVRDRDRL